MNKNTLRQIIIRKRNGLSHAENQKKSFSAQQNLISAQIWQDAETVCLFASLPEEIETLALIQTALDRNKIVLLPRIMDLHEKIIEFFPCSDLKELAPGSMNILEPGIGKASVMPDLIIMPGLAFDWQGNRIGYGGGFYDRFLDRHPDIKAPRIGFCFRFQIVANIPADAWDYKVHGLCTEDNFRWL